jgi:hypothetical protein
MRSLLSNLGFRSLTGVFLLILALFAQADSLVPENAARGFAARTPLFFEPLAPSGDAPFRFVSRGANYLFAIAPAEARIVLQKASQPGVEPGAGRTQVAGRREVSARTVQVRFLGANPVAELKGDSSLPGKINYFVGADPAQWRCDVSTFAKVRVTELYPGISLIYYGNQRLLEYDFELAPGADVNSIAIHFDGMDRLRVSENGELVISLGSDEIRQPRPDIYQIVNGIRKPVRGGYRLKGLSTICFTVGYYDKALPLVIDPVLSYSTYFGGNFGEQAFAVKVDVNGFIYLAGETLSTTFFSTPGYDNTFGGGKNNGDAFIAKLDNTGSNLLYFSYLGGTSDDAGLDIAVDSSQHAYITGFTVSTDFPTNLPPDAAGLTNRIGGVSDPIVHAFPTDAFVAELDTTTNGASSLVFSGYLGGGLADVGIGIALDSGANVYVTGYTFSTNFPTTPGSAYQTNCKGSNDVFISKIGAGAHGFLYSSYLGGTNVDEGQGIAVAGNLAFITGYTGSTNFPFTTYALKTNINTTTNAAIQFKNKPVPLDAFVAEFDTSLAGSNSLLYCSYFGGANNDAGYRITLDASSNVYITGNTTSTNFPDTTNHMVMANYRTNAFNYDSIVAKFGLLDTATPTNFFSFPFGGSANDVGWDIAVDPAGDIFIAGVTSSFTNFPTTTNIVGLLRAGTNSGGTDAFVMGFAPDASSLLYSAYFGGSANDFGYGIATDGAGSAYIVGQTYSTNFPTNAISFQSTRAGTNDAFLAKIELDPVLAVAPAGGQIQLSWRGTSFAPLTLQSSTNVQIPGAWADIPVSPAQVNGRYTVTLPPTNGAAGFRLRR